MVFKVSGRSTPSGLRSMYIAALAVCSHAAAQAKDRFAVQRIQAPKPRQKRTTNKKLLHKPCLGRRKTAIAKNPVLYKSQPSDFLISDNLPKKEVSVSLVDSKGSAKPQENFKALLNSFNNRTFDGISVLLILKEIADSLFVKADHKKILTKDLKWNDNQVAVLQLYKDLFREKAPKDNYVARLSDLEPGNFQVKTDNPRIKLLIETLFSRGAFFEFRTKVALSYLKKAKIIKDFKQTKKHSYLDKLGIDFLVRFSTASGDKVLPIQVKSSDDRETNFSKPKKILWYNKRNNLERETKVKREGIVVLRPDKTSLSKMAIRIRDLVNRNSVSIDNEFPAIEYAPPLEMDPKAISDWYKQFEQTYIKALCQDSDLIAA